MTTVSGACAGGAVDAGGLECFLFANRQQWGEFTAKHTGGGRRRVLSANQPRLVITRGVVFVAKCLGDIGTYS